jgi:hypothetical protein
MCSHMIPHAGSDDDAAIAHMHVAASSPGAGARLRGRYLLSPDPLLDHAPVRAAMYICRSMPY